jgi:nucleoside 2-deoxyribosyltransferase
VKVYVAAPWVRKQEAIAAGEQLKAAGFEVTSRWFYHEGDPNDSTGVGEDREQIRMQAREDINDVLNSDALVVLNLEMSEGKAVETGIALAYNLPVISVGGRSNIFQALGVEVNSLDDAIQVLNLVPVMD